MSFTVPLLLEPPLVELLLVALPPLELLVTLPPPELLVAPPELELFRSLLPELLELVELLPEPLEVLDPLEFEFRPFSDPLLLPDGAPPSSFELLRGCGEGFPSWPSSVFDPAPDVAQAWRTPTIKATRQDDDERSSRFTGTPAKRSPSRSTSRRSLCCAICTRNQIQRGFHRNIA